MFHYLSIKFNVLYYFGLNYFNSNFTLISIILTSIKIFTTFKNWLIYTKLIPCHHWSLYVIYGIFMPLCQRYWWNDFSVLGSYCNCLRPWHEHFHNQTCHCVWIDKTFEKPVPTSPQLFLMWIPIERWDEPLGCFSPKGFCEVLLLLWLLVFTI